MPPMSGGAIKAGSAYIAMGLNTQNLEKGTARVMGHLNKVANFAVNAGKTAGAMSAPLVGVLLAGTAALNGYIRRMSILASRTGLTIQQADAFSQLAASVGASESSIEVATKTFGERLNQIRRGSAEVVQAFNDLKIDEKEFITDSVLERMAKVADGLQDIGDIGARSGILLAIAGEAGSQISPLLGLGGDTIRRLGGGIGTQITPEMEYAANAFSVTMILLKTEFMKAGAALATTVVPWFVRLSTVLLNVSAMVSKVAQRNKLWIGILFAVAGAAAAAATAMVALNLAMAAFDVLASPVIGAILVVAAGVASLTTALFGLSWLIESLILGTFKLTNMSDTFTDFIDRLISGFIHLFHSIMKYFNIVSLGLVEKFGLLKPVEHAVAMDKAANGKIASTFVKRMWPALMSMGGGSAGGPTRGGGGWGGWTGAASDSRIWGNQADSATDILDSIRGETVHQTSLQQVTNTLLGQLNKNIGAN